MQNALQAALAGLALKPLKPAPKAPPAPRLSRTLPFNTLTPDYPLVPASVEVEANTDSRPPPEHEPNFSERYFK